MRLQNQVESLLEEAHIKLSSLVTDLLGVYAWTSSACPDDKSAGLSKMVTFGVGTPLTQRQDRQ